MAYKKTFEDKEHYYFLFHKFRYNDDKTIKDGDRCIYCAERMEHAEAHNNECKRWKK